MMDKPYLLAYLTQNKKHYFAVSLTFIFCFFSFSGILAQSLSWLDISLQSVAGEELTIQEAMGENGAVLLFLDPDCPVSQKYGATIRELSEQFKQQGIQTIAIYPLVRLDTSSLQTFIQEYHYNFTHLPDPKLKLTKTIEAAVTPEAYLLSDSGNIMYQGAIDNWFYALGRYRKAVTEHYLREAVEAYLQQKPVAQKKTEAIGCMIGTGMLQGKEHH